MAEAGPDAATPAAALLDALRASGAEGRDPVRFRFLEALARRAEGHSGEARRRLDERLVRAATALGERCAASPSANALATGDSAPPASPLAELLAHIRDHALPEAPSHPHHAATQRSTNHPTVPLDPPSARSAVNSAAAVRAARCDVYVPSWRGRCLPVSVSMPSRRTTHLSRCLRTVGCPVAFQPILGPPRVAEDQPVPVDTAPSADTSVIHQANEKGPGRSRDP